MKYLLALFLIFGFNFSLLADDQDIEHTHEDEYEDGCSNEIDDDMDGNIDEDDEDCKVVALVESSSGVDLSPYLVWGLGIAILSSVDGSSGTGTATNN